MPYGYFAYNPSRINVGSVDWQRYEENVIVSPLYTVFRCLEGLNEDYLKYFLKSDKGKYYIQSKNGGSVRNSLKFDDLSEFEIDIKEIDEQLDIVDKLKTIEQAIAHEERQLDLYDELIKARFVEMFGNPATNPRKLEIKTLPELGEFGRGVSKHRPRNDEALLGGPYPLIQTGDVSNSDLFITEYNSTYSELGLKQSKMWNAGTLCITIAANIAKTAILGFDACFPDSVVGFNANERTNNIFMHYWFMFFQEILEAQAPESAQKNINIKILSNLEIIVPNIDEQNIFAKFVLQVKDFKEESRKRIDLYKELFEKIVYESY